MRTLLTVIALVFAIAIAHAQPAPVAPQTTVLYGYVYRTNLSAAAGAIIITERTIPLASQPFVIGQAQRRDTANAAGFISMRVLRNSIVYISAADRTGYLGIPASPGAVRITIPDADSVMLVTDTSTIAIPQTYVLARPLLTLSDGITSGAISALTITGSSLTFDGASASMVLNGARYGDSIRVADSVSRMAYDTAVIARDSASNARQRVLVLEALTSAWIDSTTAALALARLAQDTASYAVLLSLAADRNAGVALDSARNAMFRADGAANDLVAHAATVDAHLPAQAGNTGRFLKTDGAVSSWADVPNPDLTPYMEKADSVKSVSMDRDDVIKGEKTFDGKLASDTIFVNGIKRKPPSIRPWYRLEMDENGRLSWGWSGDESLVASDLGVFAKGSGGVTLTSGTLGGAWPTTDNTLGLGINIRRWKQMYLSGTAYMKRILADSSIISSQTVDGYNVRTDSLRLGLGLNMSKQPTASIVAENSVESNISIALQPKGTGAFYLGPKADGTATGGNARGSYTVDLQMGRNAATNIPTTSYSILAGGYLNKESGYTAGANGIFAGYNNTLSGGYSSVIVGGYENALNCFDQLGSATLGGYRNSLGGGVGAIIAGAYNTIGSAYGVIVGGTRNKMSSSVLQTQQNAVILGGYGANAKHVGEVAFAYSFSDTSGNAQTSFFNLRDTTVNTATDTLTFTGSEIAAAAYTRFITIDSGRAYTYSALVSARSDVGDAASYKIEGGIKRVGATTSMVGTPTITTLAADATAATWAVTAVADDTNDALHILVTGAANKLIRWHATVTISMVGF